MLSVLAMDILPSVVENFAILFFMSFCLRFKKKIPHYMKLIIWIVATAILCSLSFLGVRYATYEIVFMALAILVCILYGIVFLQGSVINVIFTSLIPFILIAIINSFTLFLFSKLSSIPMINLVHEHNVIRVMILAVTKGSFILGISLIARLSPKSDFVFKKSEIVAIILIFLSCLLVTLFIFVKQTYSVSYYDKDTDPFFILAVFGLIIINILTYVSYLKIEKENRAHIKYELLRMQVEQQRQSYEEMNQKTLEIRKIRHDMRNYLEGCLALMQTGEYEKAQEYLDHIYKEEIKPINYTIVTNSSLINAVLNNKVHICKKEGIDIDYKILTDFTGFEELDICILLGNMWDNAIEASKQVEKGKRIEFEVSGKKNYLVISLKNRIKESVLHNNPKLCTTKQDKANHGFGIISMKDIVGKYEGNMEITEENKMIEFHLILKREI